MPKWLLITIIAVLGLAGAAAAYLVTTQQLDKQHERYVRGLVVQYGQRQTPGSTSPADTSTTTNDGTASSTDGALSLEQSIVASGTAVLLDTQDPLSSYMEFSVEIGAITIDNVRFEVGMSWQNDDQTETYTVTKIIQKSSGVDLYYETGDGTQYVFQMVQNPAGGGGFSIVGAPPTISVSVDTTPDQDDGDSDLSTSSPTSTTPGGGNNQSTSTSATDPNNPTSDPTSSNEPTPSDNDDPYVIVYTTPTTTPTTTSPADPTDPTVDPTPDPTPTPDPDPADDEEDTGPVSLAPTSTSPTSTSPTDPDPEPSQPYNDGTYQYKADAQYVPYTPPLYDRTEDEDVSVAP